jgi:5'-deoxynucleotidase YfbR-like HD superfamily hydrolase
MNEKTFTGEILTSIADHFATVLEELPQDTDPESKLGVALAEIQDLLATWMSFDVSEEDEVLEDETIADEAEATAEGEEISSSDEFEDALEEIEVVQGEVVIEGEDA